MSTSQALEESLRIRFTKQLLAFREDEALEEWTFPPSLSPSERKWVHHLAKELGLESKSSGKGAERFITASRHFDALRELPISQSVHTLMDNYFSSFPVLAEEMETLYAAAAAKALERSRAEDNLEAGVLGEQVLQVPPPPRRSRRRHRWDAHNPHVLESRMVSYSISQQQREGHPDFFATTEARARLPAWEYRQAVADLVVNNQVVMVSGGTGCGKSTQVPQFLLDDPRIGPSCNMVVTQPRRISAIGVAERVAEERHEEIGKSIGYAVRMDVVTTKTTQITFMTPGVLLRRLMSDPVLGAITHVIIDEVHERDQNTEFLLIVLRDLCSQRSDLRIVLMSATLQSQKFSEYFDGIPIVTIGASTFPVEEFFLEDALSQTRWLESKRFLDDEKRMGGYNPSAARKASEMIETLTFSEPGQNSEFTCAMCGRSGFRSVIELGTHMGSCTGPILDSGPGNLVSVPENQPIELDGLEDLEAALDSLMGSTSELVLMEPPSQAHQRSIEPEKVLSFAEKLRGVKDEENDQNTDAAFRNDVNLGADVEVFDTGDGGDFDEQDYIGVDGPGPRVAGGIAQEAANTVDELADVVLSRSGSRLDEEALQRYQYVHDDSEVDVDLIVALLEYIYNSEYEKGATLIFMPGWQEISTMKDALGVHDDFGNPKRFRLLPLHSGIPTQKQKEIFKPVPRGCHKIIISTNIAETSITVPEVVFVVDSGRVKEKSYDPHMKTSTMDVTWVTKASSKQRRGRAGRVRAGCCWHLFSLRRYESLREHVESELQRTSLEELCLQAKGLNLTPGSSHDPNGLRAFLGKAVDPPHPLAVDHGIRMLIDIGAFRPDGSEQLTRLGAILSDLVVHPRLGKMILWGLVLNCATSAVKLAAMCSYREPFVLPAASGSRRQANSAKKALARGLNSDHMALLGALNGFESTSSRARKQFCDESFLSYSTLQMSQKIASQVAADLRRFGFKDPLDSSACLHSRESSALMCSVLAAGLYPHVARRLQGETNYTCSQLTADGRKVRVSPRSVLSKGKEPKCTVQEEVVAFGELTRSSSKAQFGPNLLINQVTAVPPLALVLLCGTIEIEELPEDDEEEFGIASMLQGDPSLGSGRGAGARSVILTLDGWLSYLVPRPVALKIQVLRLRLHEVFNVLVNSPKSRPSEALRGSVHFASQMFVAEMQGDQTHDSTASSKPRARSTPSKHRKVSPARSNSTAGKAGKTSGGKRKK